MLFETEMQGVVCLTVNRLNRTQDSVFKVVPWCSRQCTSLIVQVENPVPEMLEIKCLGAQTFSLDFLIFVHT